MFERFGRGISKRATWALVAAIIVVAVVVAGRCGRGFPSDVALNAFRTALENQHYRALYALATDLEKARLGVTLAGITRAFQETAFKDGRRVRTALARIDTPAQAMDR